MNTRIGNSWDDVLKEEFEKPSFRKYADFVDKERRIFPDRIFPMEEEVFRAFKLCPFENVKVVILGQDPYSHKGQANGLCFSVNEGQKIPVSLRNIIRIVHNKKSSSGNLEKWAEQGVLLLNRVLTVQMDLPKSHYDKGCEQFTEAVISILNEKTDCCFVLWGNEAQKVSRFISEPERKIIGSHPASRNGTFSKQNYFDTVNEYLNRHGKKEIVWDVFV